MHHHVKRSGDRESCRHNRSDAGEQNVFRESVPMTRFLSILVLCWLALVSTAQAGPKHVLARIGEVTLDHILPAATSLLATNAIHNCRQRFGIGGGCPDGGYGEFKAREAIRFGFSVGMGEASHGCFASVQTKKWACLFIAAVPVTINTVTTIQARNHHATFPVRP